MEPDRRVVSCHATSPAEPGVQAGLEQAKQIIANARRIVSPRGIERVQTVHIGGIEQWVSIRGTDRRNPVLLVLHGGPGYVAMPVGPGSAGILHCRRVGSTGGGQDLAPERPCSGHVDAERRALRGRRRGEGRVAAQGAEVLHGFAAEPSLLASYDQSALHWPAGSLEQYDAGR